MMRRRFHLPLSIALLNVILAIFPIITGTIIYNKILTVVTADLVENNIRNLKDAMVSFEKNYSNLGKTIHSLQNTTSIIRLKNISEPYRDGNVIRLLECNADFNLIMSNREEDFIIDSFLYFSSNDVVITPLSMYRGSDYFNFQFRLPEGDQEKWLQLLKNTNSAMKITPQQDITYQNKELKTNLFIHSIWPDQPNTEVYFIALLDRNFFFNHLKGMEFSSEGSFTVISNDVILYQDGDSNSSSAEFITEFKGYAEKEGYQIVKDDNSNKLITYVYSFLRKTSYFLENNSIEQISSVLGNIRRNVMFGGIIYVLIASLLTLFLTRRNRATLMSSHAIAKQQLLSGLYSGTIINHEEMEAMWERLDLPQEGKFWGMTHVTLNPYGESSPTEILIQHQIDVNFLEGILSSLMESFFSLHFDDSQYLRLYLVQSFAASDMDRACQIWKDDLHRLIEYFTDTKNILLYVGYGLLQQDRMLLYISHAQARQALNSILRTRQPGIRQYVEEGSRGGAHLPENIFHVLESYLFQGDVAGIDSVFDTFRTVLFDPQLSMVMRQYLITKIYGSVIEITERTGQLNSVSWTPEFFSTMNNTDKIEELFLQLREKTKITGVKIVSKKRSHNTELLDQIISEIYNNLDNQNINAATIAITLDISESYLYQFFKEQTGTTFASFLESQRMEKARHLLTETDSSVKEISEKVGYGSSNTFGRAFKRNFAMSAGQFRKNRKGT